ncbi:putative prolyl 4-hydroxylase 6 [Diplonema papillatum]|nr:putative prolyl 4-hydroxylase 6 [Diplonema papillatum]
MPNRGNKKRSEPPTAAEPTKTAGAPARTPSGIGYTVLFTLAAGLLSVGYGNKSAFTAALTRASDEVTKVPCGAQPTVFDKWVPGAGEQVEVCIENEPPVKVTGLSESPGIFHIAQLVKDREIERILKVSTPLLKPSHLKDVTGQERFTDWRKSTMITLHAKNGLATLNKRIAQILRLPLEMVLNSMIQIQKYDANDRYFPHYDSRDVHKLGKERSPSGDTEGFPYSGRLATVVMYMNTVESGHTIFPLVNYSAEEAYTLARKLDVSGDKSLEKWEMYCSEPNRYSGIAVQPKRGDAVVFYNHQVPSPGVLGQMDPRSFHGGCTVGPGEVKLMANFWIHVRPPDFQKDAPNLPKDVAVNVDKVFSPAKK